MKSWVTDTAKSLFMYRQIANKAVNLAENEQEDELDDENDTELEEQIRELEPDQDTGQILAIANAIMKKKHVRRGPPTGTRGQNARTTTGNVTQPERKQTTRDGEPRCANCAKIGHTTGSCGSPIVEMSKRPCSTCGQLGHTSKFCKRNPKNATAPKALSADDDDEPALTIDAGTTVYCSHGPECLPYDSDEDSKEEKGMTDAEKEEYEYEPRCNFKCEERGKK